MFVAETETYRTLRCLRPVKSDLVTTVRLFPFRSLEGTERADVSISAVETSSDMDLYQREEAFIFRNQHSNTELLLRLML